MIERAVVNASPLILLGRTGLLHLLPAVAREVAVPDEVEREVRAKGDDDAAAVALAAAGWIIRARAFTIPPLVAQWQLGRGESAVLAETLLRPGSAAIVDDREARRCAQALKRPTFGTIGVVLRAKRAGAIPNARPLLEQLCAAGMYVNQGLFAAALAQVDE